MDKITALRQQLDANVEVTASVLEGMTTEEISLLVHELWTRQNDIEAENEELRKVQSQLEAVQDKYTDLYDFAPIGYCVFDSTGLIRQANHAIARQIGVERNLLLNTRFDLYLIEDDRATFLQHLETVFVTNVRNVCEVRLRTGEGQYVSVRLESSSRQEGGHDSQCRTVIIDSSVLSQKDKELREIRSRLECVLQEHSQQLHQEVTERERVGQALQISEQQYRLLAEAVSDGIAIIQDQRIQFANRAFAALFGGVVERFLGTNPVNLFKPAQQERVDTMLQSIMPDSIPQHFQAEAVTETGREIWLAGEIGPIDWEGNPALLLTVRDMTEQKLREMTMEEERNRLSKELIRLKSSVKNRYRFGDIIGKSAAMQQVYDQIVRASATDTSVFISGESGTGKELIARTIHKMSKRRDQRFVPVNCGAIPESLFESEFFGHRKGSFTGAFRDKEGFFSVAHNGTLFLDELGELSPGMQVKLLRVLDDGEYTRIGDTTVKKANVRILAATNRNVDEMRQTGQIREDFFFRIHVFALTLPPLRDRKEDIPLLINHFLERYSDERPLPILSSDVMEILYAYDWPGNVREFQNALQRHLSGQPLNLRGRETTANPPLHFSSFPERQESGQEFQHIMEAFEKKLILSVLEQHRWNKSKTAAVLGIPRRTLYRKMARYGIN